MRKVGGVKDTPRKSMYQLQVAIPQDYEDKLIQMEETLEREIKAFKKELAEKQEAYTKILEERVERESQHLASSIDNAINYAGDMDDQVRASFEDLRAEVKKISWTSDIENALSPLHDKFKAIEEKIISVHKSIPTPKEYDEDIKTIRDGLTTREKAEEEFRAALKMIDGEFKKVRKNVSEMGYSLLLMTDGKTVGTTPALNLAAGTGVTLTSAFVNGIPRVTINSSGGSGFTTLPATGTVNGANTSFTFTQKPTYIVSDHAWYQENKGWTWDAGTLTAAMTVPPVDDIFGVA